MQSMTARLEEVEDLTDRHDNDILDAQRALNAHSSQICDMNRHIEDLEHRGAGITSE